MLDGLQMANTGTLRVIQQSISQRMDGQNLEVIVMDIIMDIEKTITVTRKNIMVTRETDTERKIIVGVQVGNI